MDDFSAIFFNCIYNSCTADIKFVILICYLFFLDQYRRLGHALFPLDERGCYWARSHTYTLGTWISKNRWAAFFEDFVFSDWNIWFSCLFHRFLCRLSGGYWFSDSASPGRQCGFIRRSYGHSFIKMLSASIAGAASIPTDNLPPSLLP